MKIEVNVNIVIHSEYLTDVLLLSLKFISILISGYGV